MEPLPALQVDMDVPAALIQTVRGFGYKLRT